MFQVITSYLADLDPQTMTFKSFKDSQRFLFHQLLQPQDLHQIPAGFLVEKKKQEISGIPNAWQDHHRTCKWLGMLAKELVSG